MNSRTGFYLLCFLACLLARNSSYAAPAPCAQQVNNSCANSTLIVDGAACTNGTTCGGTPTAATCLGGANTSTWYSFVATNDSMVVQIDFLLGTCAFSSAVYSGACGSLTQVGCQAANGAAPDQTLFLLTLIPGNTYFIQISYEQSGPCGNDGFATFCVEVDQPDLPCSTCSTPCGTALGYVATPSVATVTADCQTTPFVPPLAAASTHTYCYSFQATALTVDFNIIITSNCGGGNVSAFSWQLFNVACGGAIMSGTLASLTFTPLVVGNNYVFCYTFTVPAGCTHSQHCPYFVGAIVLPIELENFDVAYNGKSVDLFWTTFSEMNNDFFSVEKSVDGVNFNTISTVKGALNSSELISYRSVDLNPTQGVSYYRLKQTDIDGTTKYSETKTLTVNEGSTSLTVYPNPSENNIQLLFNSQTTSEAIVEIHGANGQLVKRVEIIPTNGFNSINVDITNLDAGVYIIMLKEADQIRQTKFVKN